MKNRGRLMRIDIDLDELIRILSKKNAVGYREASRDIARKLRHNGGKNEIIF